MIKERNEKMKEEMMGKSGLILLFFSQILIFDCSVSYLI